MKNKYKVGQTVYFEDNMQKGVGKIVGVTYGNSTTHYLVHSTQIIFGHNGNHIDEIQNNDDNWYFLESELELY